METRAAIAYTIPWMICLILAITTVFYANVIPEQVIVEKEVQLSCEPKIITREVIREVEVEIPCSPCVCTTVPLQSTLPICDSVSVWECQRGVGGWGVRYIEKECTNGQTLIFDCQTNTSRYS